MTNLKSLVNYEIDIREDKFSYEKGKPNFVMASNGIFKVLRNDAILNKVQIAELSGSFKVPLLSTITPEFEYLLPKIPFKHYINILDFFKAVHAQDGTEASCMIYYNHTDDDLVVPKEFETLADNGLDIDGKWLVYAPTQVNSSTLTDFANDDFDSWLRNNYTKVIECHSHHTMNSFWSGTDNANQKENMFYGVFGQINRLDSFLLKAVANDGVIYDNLDVTTLFEYPHVASVKVVQDVPEGMEGVCQETDVESVVPYTGAFNTLNNFKQSWLNQHTTARSFISKKGSSQLEILDFVDSSEKEVKSIKKPEINVKSSKKPKRNVLKLRD